MSWQATGDPDFLRARELIGGGDFAGAESLLHSTLARQPQNVTALYLLAAIAEARGDRAAGADLLTRAAELAPNDAAIRAALGRMLVQIDRVDAAVAELEAAARLQPSAEVLSDLSHVQLRMGRADAAERSARQAISLNSRFAIAHCNLGAALRELRRSGDAADSYAAAARIQPEMFEAYYFAGVAHAEAQNFDRADSAWRDALRRQPGVESLRKIGAVLVALAQAERALPYLRQAVDLNPSDLTSLIALCAALAEAQRHSELEEVARRAVAAHPESTQAHNNLALALERRNELDGALAAHEASLKLDPNQPQAIAAAGELTSRLGRVDDGLQRSRAAFAAAPDDEFVRGALFITLLRAGIISEATEIAISTLARHPASPQAHANVATAIYESGDTPAAVDAIRHALAIEPKSPVIGMNHGMMLLSQGNFAQGWREYSHREKPEPIARLRPWDGSNLHDKPIILRVEQGFGDTIQFVRYAPMVAQDRGGRVIIHCAAPIQRLLSTVPQVQHVVTLIDDPRAERVRVSAYMLDLPVLFNTTLETIPASVPYLSVPAPANIVRRESLMTAIRSDEEGAIRVGLVWAGNATYGQDSKRSLRIAQIAPMVTNQAGARFFSLHVNPIAQRDRAAMDELGIVDLSSSLGDFGDTAAALSELDLLIAVDTGVAHLAGALARPVWIMLPYVCDWRWMRDRDDSPWYPTMRLFRQPKIGDWTSVIARVTEALRERVSSENK